MLIINTFYLFGAKFSYIYILISFSDGRNAAILWCLHGYLVPTQKFVRKDKDGKRTTVRYTIKDSQESFMFVAPSIQAIEDHIIFLKSRSENVQPFIAVVGTNIFDVQEIYIYFDGIKYPFKNIIRAVDICFKIFYLFNLEYPNASLIFWNFIQNFFYKLKTKTAFSRVGMLVDEIANKQTA